MNRKSQFIVKCTDAALQMVAFGYFIAANIAGYQVHNTFALAWTYLFYIALVQVVSCIVALCLPSGLVSKSPPRLYIACLIWFVLLGFFGLIFWPIFLVVLGLFLLMALGYYGVTIIDLWHVAHLMRDQRNRAAAQKPLGAAYKAAAGWVCVQVYEDGGCIE